MTCDICNKHLAVIKHTQFIRHTAYRSHKAEAKVVDVCRTCYREALAAQAQKRMKFQYLTPRRKKK